MPLLNGSVDELIMAERKNIQKYLDGQVDLKIILDKWDEYLLRDMEDENIWLEKRL